MVMTKSGSVPPADNSGQGGADATSDAADVVSPGVTRMEKMAAIAVEADTGTSATTGNADSAYVPGTPGSFAGDAGDVGGLDSVGNAQAIANAGFNQIS